MTVNAAFGRWYDEHGQHLDEHENLMPRLARLLTSLGKDKFLSKSLFDLTYPCSCEMVEASRRHGHVDTARS